MIDFEKLQEKLYKRLMELEPDQPHYFQTLLIELMPIIEDELSAELRRYETLSAKPRQSKEESSA